MLLKVAMAIRFFSEASAAVYGSDAKQPHSGKLRNHAHIDVNVEDRREAEFTDDEINEMLRQYGMGSLAESGAAK